jgi:hypothetical protein
MSRQLLSRAWDALDSFKQAYPENWHEDDQQVLDDLMKADLDLSRVRREWVGLTKEEVKEISFANRPYVVDMVVALEAKLKEKNT